MAGVLSGVDVAVTRPVRQAAALGAALAARGARVLYAPLIRIDPPADPGALRNAIAGLHEYDWVVFTSTNAVAAFLRDVDAAGISDVATHTRIAAVGATTADALRQGGIEPAVVPADFVSGELVRALAEFGNLAGQRVLFPKARQARRTVPDGLRSRGASVDEIECYQTVADRTGAAALRAALDAGSVDVIAFTSPSQVDAFVKLVGEARPDTVFAAIGPVTATTARRHGLQVHIEPLRHDVAGLVEGVCHWFARHGGAAAQAGTPPQEPAT